MEDKKVPTRINAELIYYQLAEIKTQLQDFKVNYVTKEESAALKYEIEELKRNRTLVGWIYPTATAILTAVLTFIIIEFFRRKG